MSWQNVTPSSTRKNLSGLSRKPLLTKSNSMQPRRPPDLGMKSLGVEHDAQENFVRRLCQINGVSPLGRRGLEAAGKPSRLSLVGTSITLNTVFRIFTFSLHIKQLFGFLFYLV